jgi:serine/threonine-protein phosphatase 6 regulatory ankyrin repeat subunit B
MTVKRKVAAKSLAGPLRHAAATGNVKRLRELLAQGAQPDQRATGQPTPLIAAAEAGHLDVVKELLTAGANPSFAHGGKRGITALLRAIGHHHFDVASTLLAAGADVHHDFSGEGQTITYVAAEHCNKLFKSPKAADNAKVPACLQLLRKLLAAGGRMRSGSLVDAATLGNVKLIHLLLEFGIDINESSFGNTPLSVAIFNRSENLAVDLLRRGANPWVEEKRSILSGLPPIVMAQPCLHQAVMSDLLKVIRAFIEVRADLNRQADIAIGEAPPETLIEDKDARGNVIGREWKFHPRPMARKATALIVAVRTGKTKIVRLLVEGGADMEISDADGFTPLAWALKLNERNIAATLRKAGAKQPKHLHGSAQHALITAAVEGNLELLRIALADGADINARFEYNNDEFTALLHAAYNGHLAIVEELLKAGANPNETGRDEDLEVGITPLMLASRAGHAEIVKKLLNAAARTDLHQVNQLTAVFGRKSERGRPDNTAIHEAAAAGHTEIVRLLLDAGASLKDKSRTSGTALEAAAASGNKTTLDTVLKAKSKKGRKPSMAATALVEAVESGSLENVRALLDAGADANSCTRSGDTPLASAIITGNAAVVKLLLNAGAKPNVSLNKGTQSELMLAAGGGYVDIINLLIKAGADINATGNMGSALHLAVTHGHVDAVKMLLKAGASTKLRDDEGKTPLKLAEQIITVWSGRPTHPLLAKPFDLAPYKSCVVLLRKAATNRNN